MGPPLAPTPRTNDRYSSSGGGAAAGAVATEAAGAAAGATAGSWNGGACVRAAAAERGCGGRGGSAQPACSGASAHGGGGALSFPLPVAGSERSSFLRTRRCHGRPWASLHCRKSLPTLLLLPRSLRRLLPPLLALLLRCWRWCSVALHWFVLPSVASSPSAALLCVVKLSLHVLHVCCGRHSGMPVAAFLRRHPRRQYPPCPSASRLRTPPH